MTFWGLFRLVEGGVARTPGRKITKGKTGLMARRTSLPMRSVGLWQGSGNPVAGDPILLATILPWFREMDWVGPKRSSLVLSNIVTAVAI